MQKCFALVRVALLLAVAAGCGTAFSSGDGGAGGADDDDADVSSSAAAGGKGGSGPGSSSSSSNATSSSSSGGGLCPPQPPLGGASCSIPATEVCTYTPCCPDLYTCVGGHWQRTVTPCPAPACPPTAPQTGQDCACLEGLSCPYDTCGTGQVNANATCEAGHWNVEQSTG